MRIGEHHQEADLNLELAETHGALAGCNPVAFGREVRFLQAPS